MRDLSYSKIFIPITSLQLVRVLFIHPHLLQAVIFPRNIVEHISAYSDADPQINQFFKFHELKVQSEQ